MLLLLLLLLVAAVVEEEAPFKQIAPPSLTLSLAMSSIFTGLPSSATNAPLFPGNHRRDTPGADLTLSGNKKDTAVLKKHLCLRHRLGFHTKYMKPFGETMNDISAFLL